jgi:hypothetical protein
MLLDLSTLEHGRSRWIELREALEGFRIEIKYRTMKERERFESKMHAAGIFTKDGTVARGRISQLIAAFTEEVVIGWEVPERFRAADSKETNPPYSPAEFCKVLDAAPKSIDFIMEELAREADFFSKSGNGSMP